MHSPEARAEVETLARRGWSDAAIGGQTGLARTTVRDMRRAASRLRCPRCWRGARAMRFSEGEYAELLGFYLGDDGYIVRAGRSYRLRLVLDAAHPLLADEARSLLAGCFGETPSA